MSKPPYLGLDVGLRRTGVALSETGTVARPLGTVELNGPHLGPLLERVLGFVKDYEIMTIVVGAPLGEADEATAQATKTAAIVDSLTAALPDGVNIVQVNEFASTQEAQERFPDVDKDAGAAAIILERYLETLGDAAWSQL